MAEAADRDLGLHCALSASAWTDLPSNAVALADKLGVASLKQLCAGRLTDDLLAAAVHELTHHWCFASPVGQALTLLHLETLCQVASAGGSIQGANAERLLARVARYEQVVAGLRPIAEGMALFAEFEASP